MTADGSQQPSKIKTVKRSIGVVEVTLNRAEKLNALDDGMYSDLERILRDLEQDNSVRCVVLSAEGRGFCAGSDVSAMLQSDLKGGRNRLRRRHAVIRQLAGMEKPVIASVRGPVAGIGFSLAMACDLIVASDTAYFSQAFRNVGLIPDGGGAHLLQRRVGVGRAKDLVFTGRKLPATEAFDWGIVNEVVPDDDLDARTMELAADLAIGPTLALTLAKKLIDGTVHLSLDAALEVENHAVGVARVSKDHEEGVAAFKEKRKPKFRGV